MEPSSLTWYHWILLLLMALLMAVAGVAHFVKPRMFEKIIPDFIPLKRPIVYISGAVELVFAIGLLVPYSRALTAQGIFWMLVAYLPIHAWDLFRKKPVIGPLWVAIIRLPMQFVLMFWAYWLAGSLFF